MGFNDREIVALSGGHTLGRMHEVRSGYDGPWTHGPLKFDNTYYQHLINFEWKEKEWHGKKMYTDVATGKLGMLPTDMALKTDPGFRQYAEIYARDEKQFFHDFAWAYAKLISLGCPPECDPTLPDRAPNERKKLSAEFRDYAMHGSILPCKQLARSGKVDVHEAEPTSGRTALHKAAYWAHLDLVNFLIQECKINPNAQVSGSRCPRAFCVRCFSRSSRQRGGTLGRDCIGRELTARWAGRMCMATPHCMMQRASVTSTSLAPS